MRPQIIIPMLMIIFVFVSCRIVNKAENPGVLPVALIVSSSAPEQAIVEPSFEDDDKASFDSMPVESVDIAEKEASELDEFSEDSVVREPSVVLQGDPDPVLNGSAPEAHITVVSDAELRDFEEAMAACKKAVKMKPDQVEAYYKLGSMYTELAMYDEAIESYEKFLEINPVHPEVIYNLGVTYMMIDDLEHAYLKYDTLRKQSPRLAETLYQSIVQHVLNSDMHKYFVQVGSYKNPVYAADILDKLKGLYKYVYIFKENNFSKVRVIGIETKIEGESVKKKVRSGYGLTPFVREV